MESWALIYNPRAGSFRESSLEAVAAALREEGVIAKLLPTGHAGHATQLAAEARGVTCVAVYGGDGTLNEAANGLLGRDTPLAFLPGGTANVMALELGLPINPPRAAALLARGRARPVRPGMVDGRCFLLMAGFGFDAEAVHTVNPRLKKVLGKGAYGLSTLRALSRRQPGMRVIAGDGPPFPVAWVVAARARHYAGRYVIHPGAGLEAPSLGLVAVPPGWVLPFLIGRLGLRLPFKSCLSPLAQGGCRIEAEAPIHAQVDGDYLGQGTSFQVRQADKPLLLHYPAK